MRRHTVFGLLLAVAIFACSGSSGPSGPVGGGIAGTYSGTHQIVILLGTQPLGFQCNGSVVVQASGSSLTGTLVLDPCPPFFAEAGSNPFTGTLQGTTITLIVGDQGALINELRDQLGCTVVRVDQGFVGTLENGRLRATFTGTFQCPQGRVDVTWTIDMTKTA